MAFREADADIGAVSFRSCTLNKEVSGTMPSPDVGGRSLGMGVGDRLLQRGRGVEIPTGLGGPALALDGGWAQQVPCSGLAGLQ